MGIVPLRFEPQNGRFLVANAVVAVAEAKDFVSGCNVDVTRMVDGDVHGEVRPFEEGRHSVERSVAIWVAELPDSIGGRANVVLGAEMRVALDDENPTAL